MKKLTVSKLWIILFVASFSVIASSCSKEDDESLTPAELLQGTWKCNMAGGDWDEFTFTSGSVFKYRYYESELGSINIQEGTFSATESVITLEYEEGEVDVYNYSVNGDELIVEDYLYYKQ